MECKDAGAAEDDEDGLVSYLLRSKLGFNLAQDLGISTPFPSRWASIDFEFHAEPADSQDFWRLTAKMVKETPVPNHFLEAAEVYDRLRACKDSLVAILTPEKLKMFVNILDTLIQAKGAETAKAFFDVPSFLAVAFLSAEKMERSLPAKDKEKKLGKLPRALGSVLKAMHPDAAQQADPSAAQPSAPALALPAEIEATQATLAQLRMGDLEADLCLGLSQASSTTPAPLESPALPPAPTPVLLGKKAHPSLQKFSQAEGPVNNSEENKGWTPPLGLRHHLDSAPIGPGQASPTTPAPLESPAPPAAPTPVLLGKKAHPSLQKFSQAEGPVNNSEENQGWTPPLGLRHHLDSVPIGPLGSAQTMLPAVWVLPHLGWTSVLLVDGTRAWFEDEDLAEHGYGAPTFPSSDDEEKLDDGCASSGDAGGGANGGDGASGDAHRGGDGNSGDGASGDAHGGPHGGDDDGEGYDGTFDYYEDDGGETSFFLLGEEIIDYDSPIWD